MVFEASCIFPERTALLRLTVTATLPYLFPALVNILQRNPRDEADSLAA
jgi:hypothetical protein